MQKKKFLILRNYTIEPVFNEIEDKFQNKGIKAKFDYSSYDSALPELLRMTSKKLKEYDGILIFLSFESFVSNIHKKKIKDSFLLFKNLIEEISKQLRVNKIENINWFILSHQKFITHKINNNKVQSQILKLKKKILNFYDFRSEILKFHSTKNIFDLRYWKSSMFPFSGLGLRIASNIIFIKLQLILRSKYKLLILDADNTLWNGIIDEAGYKNINFKNNLLKINYLIFQKKIKELKKKGIILCLCTKNDIVSIRNVFNYHKRKMKLKLNDFLIIKANWDDKYKNILEIHKKLNLSPENSLFIDDSNFEIESINSMIPTIDTQNILEFENYFKNIDKILLPENIKFTKEDALREKLYEDEFKRSTVKEKHKNFNKYIKSLNIVLEIKKNSTKNLTRLAQLSQRTNQFNSSAIRYDEKNLRKLLKNKSNSIYQCSAKDKFGNYGIIGLIIAENKNEKIIIKSFAMSCRALGREIEINFFNFVIKSLLRNFNKEVAILFKKTNKNKLVEDFLKKNCKRGLNWKKEIFFYPKISDSNKRVKLIKINNEK